MNHETNKPTGNSSLPANYEFNLSDFALFLSVMKHEEAYRDTLSIILGEEDLQLKEVHVEEVILNQSGERAIRLDAWAKDTRNRQIDTEMQNDTSGDDIRRRSRFYQGLIDTPILKAGKETKYKNLPSTIIIFITQEDIFHRGLAKYTFCERCVELDDLNLDDGTQKIFVNMSSKNGDPALISLLQYIKDTRLDNPDITVKDERLLRLDAVVEDVRQSEEWEAVKMNILEIGINKGCEKTLEIALPVLIQTIQELGGTKELAIQKVIEIYPEASSEAQAYVDKFWQA